ncbi:polysaccharide biosynthesis protein [Salibacterium salarium]|uniref:Polysaccharide biosynthesis protein n=1 Tax=Salibacterium salarium TaxID=284579 RepID=A0A428MS87_9BACI|nr:polysaccharide biosynthesis protein [Salibacterium salarium]RSL29033.1 polysaccharide biosynthesis protein [Salibacterium salarium]
MDGSYIKDKRFWKGAFLVTGAAFIGKILSALYRVPYQNLTGDQGLYVYQQIYPFYGAAMVIAMYGFPVVISKMVLENNSRYGKKTAQETAYASFFTLLLIHLMLFMLMYLGAEELAGFMGDERLNTALRSMSYVLLVIPFFSAIRGYYQGIEEMRPTAISHLIEQTMRVSAILLLTGLVVFAGNGAYEAGHAAAIGSIFGSVCGVLFLLWTVFKKNGQKHEAVQGKAILKQMKTNYTVMSRGILVSCGAMIFILYQFVDAFTVARILTSNGVDGAVAKSVKGVFDRGQPLLQFGTVIATSFAMAIVPLLRREELAGQIETSRYYATLAFRVSLLIGTAAAIGLMVIAEPVNVMLFKNADGTGVLQILAITLAVSGVVMTTSAVMQGHNQFVVPALFLLIGLLIKTIGNIFLLPLFEVQGAAVATVTGMSVTAFCNTYYVLVRKYMSPPSLSWLGKAVISLLGMGTAINVLKYICDLFLSMNRINAVWSALLMAGMGVLFFLWWIVKMPLFTTHERMIIPGMDKIESLFERKEKK